MTLQTPPPPPISPRQMNLLRIVSSMAWSDGHLAEEEVDLMLDRFSRLFAKDTNQQQKLYQDLQDYVTQNIPLEELTPKLTSEAEKELVLRLGYEVIGSSARTPEEDKINEEEAAAYQQLVKLLGLPSETVERVETEAKAELAGNDNIIEILAQQIKSFIDHS
ncbi:MAG: TerB family tellurite resistance protein [Thainema sp.]